MLSHRGARSSVIPAPVVASAAASAFFLTPMAVLAGLLGVWRFGVDLGWANGFFIADGLFSHYQLWFAVAIGAQMSALVLKRWVASQA